MNTLPALLAITFLALSWGVIALVTGDPRWLFTHNRKQEIAFASTNRHDDRHASETLGAANKAAEHLRYINASIGTLSLALLVIASTPRPHREAQRQLLKITSHLYDLDRLFISKRIREVASAHIPPDRFVHTLRIKGENPYRPEAITNYNVHLSETFRIESPEIQERHPNWQPSPTTDIKTLDDFRALWDWMNSNLYLVLPEKLFTDQQAEAIIQNRWEWLLTPPINAAVGLSTCEMSPERESHPRKTGSIQKFPPATIALLNKIPQVRSRRGIRSHYYLDIRSKNIAQGAIIEYPVWRIHVSDKILDAFDPQKTFSRGSFKKTFKELNEAVGAIGECRLDTLDTFLQQRSQADGGIISLAEFAVPFSIVALWGPALAALLQLYFLAHMRQFLHQWRDAQVAWIALYRLDWLSESLYLGTIVVLPVTAVFTWLFLSMEMASYSNIPIFNAIIGVATLATSYALIRLQVASNPVRSDN